MLLVFDVGNTETTIGLCDGDDVVRRWRVTTDAGRTPDEVFLLLSALLQASDVKASAIHGSAVGSVVPAVTGPLAESCERLTGKPVVVVDARSALPIHVDVEEPLTVGADRLINTLAASRLHRRDCIVVDLGTATTYDCITGDGTFLGGVIAPGVQVSAESLFRRTAKLTATELIPPVHVIGRRTEECIRSGVVYGAAEAIDGVVRRIKKEWPGKESPFVIATGGLAAVFHPLCNELEALEPDLTLKGLAIAFEILAKPK